MEYKCLEEIKARWQTRMPESRYAMPQSGRIIKEALIDIPALLAEVERLQKESKDMWDEVQKMIALDKKVCAERDHLRKERDAAIADIPHKCWKCRYSRCNTGNECELAHYTGASPDCISWEWHNPTAE